jgi:ABC-type lipoprotein release transport system permease subunit
MIGDSMEVEGVSISTHIFAGWDTTSMAAYTAVAVLLAVAATLYPAWKAGKLQPVEAMRHQ